jgi:hypothetical protein
MQKRKFGQGLEVSAWGYLNRAGRYGPHKCNGTERRRVDASPGCRGAGCQPVRRERMVMTLTQF